jgi:hypothetical protein
MRGKERGKSGEWRVESGEWRVESGEWRGKREEKTRQKTRGGCERLVAQGFSPATGRFVAISRRRHGRSFMLTLAVVLWDNPAPPDQDALVELLDRVIPTYKAVAGLRRKYFISRPGRAGGVYEWDSREAAEAYYNPDWYRRISSTYGVSPEVTLFDAPCLVDNVTGDVIRG